MMDDTEEPNCEQQCEKVQQRGRRRGREWKEKIVQLSLLCCAGVMKKDERKYGASLVMQQR